VDKIEISVKGQAVVLEVLSWLVLLSQCQVSYLLHETMRLVGKVYKKYFSVISYSLGIHKKIL
jgi:hypothetical protein